MKRLSRISIVILLGTQVAIANAESMANSETPVVPVALSTAKPDGVREEIRETVSIYKEWAKDTKSRTNRFWREVVCSSPEAFQSLSDTATIEASKLAKFRSQIRERLRAAAHNSDAAREKIIAEWKAKPDKELALECTLAVVIDQQRRDDKPCKFADGEEIYFRPLQAVCAQLASSGPG